MPLQLLDELMGDQDPRSRCVLCEWLEAQTKSERDEWTQALTMRAGTKYRFTHASIQRALKRRNVKVGRATVQTHRNSEHKS